MILAKKYELIAMHSGLGSDYNRNAARMVAGNVMRDNDQQIVDKLMIEYELKQRQEMKPGTIIESAFKH